MLSPVTNEGKAADIPVWRDVDHSGTFEGADSLQIDAYKQRLIRERRMSGEEAQAIINERLSAGDTMLIHKGGRTSTDSAGCQTVHPDSWRKFITSLGSDSRVSYTVIQMQ